MTPPDKIRRKPRFETKVPASLIAGLVLIAILLLWGLGSRPATSPPPAPPIPSTPMEPGLDGCPHGCKTPPPGCDIKGNISLRTGERIYHLPGQQYYEDAEIDPGEEERWFCTEDEARANGWRKSKR